MLISVDKCMVLLCLLLSMPSILWAADQQSGPQIELARHQAVLIDGSYAEKADSISELTERAVKGDASILLLGSLLAGELFFHKGSKDLFILKKTAEGYLARSFIDNEKKTIASKQAYKKIRINNRLRSLLRQSIAKLQLQFGEPAVRKAVVDDMLRRLNAEKIQIIKAFYPQETAPAVRESMAIIIAVADLQTADTEKIEQALAVLSDSLEPAVLNALQDYADSATDRARKDKAQKIIYRIEQKIRFFSNLETLYFGLSLGSVLVLAGIGLAITFGVMGVINMAHGELMMLGAYTSYVVQQLMPAFIELSIIVAIPAAFLVAALVGVAMERLVIRHLYGRPLETLLATFGISLILQQAVRTIFSPLNRSVVTPDWMSGLLEINSVLSLTWNRLYIIAFCLLVFTLLVLVMNKTALGLQIRAVSQNRVMARAMGVRSARVDTLVFALGAGIAGIAGVALSLLTNVGPNLGQAYIIDSFMVVVFGGVGNLFGTLFAGMGLGVMNKFMEPWVGAVMAKILLLVFIILFIQRRPQGLFSQRGRATEG